IADTCTGTGNSTACTVNPQNSYLQNYLYVLILGQLLHGVGGTTLYSLGTVFIDENVKTKVSPIYIGILYAFSALGPAIGYIVGGQFLNIYVDFENVNVENVNITPQDPRWVGAWWLGFVMAGFLAWTVTVALCAYPRELPTAKEVRATRESQAHQDGGEDEVNRPGFGKSIRDMPTAAKVLLKNPTFVFVTLAGCTEGLVTSGFATFLPKLLQNQFGLTASWAAMLTGFVAVPGAAGGQLLGGIISSKMKLKVKGMLKLSMTACVMAALLAASFWISCETPSVFGVDIPYPNSTTVQVNNITAECNAGCGCTTSSFEPICLNGQEYFTPCHAGCLSSALVNGSKVYTDCSCIAEELGSNVSAAASITTGRCTAECWTLYLFLPIALVLILFTFMSATPATSVTLRCIPDGQRAFGLGLQWVFIRFLGTVPGPILFGAIIDGTCQLWQQNCTENGSCWIYDSALMGRNFFFLGLGVKCLTALFFFLAHYCYKPPSTRKMVKSMTQQTLNVRKVSTFSSASQTSNNL
ncbi:solute carrier organic anion transporter family member 4C1, partial [Lingula anatina]|uniref:Solute carrier organic anion transporter family member n=1 Tax=Lingula anatina TaxID=7574 RepID=A0A1S3HCQ3_LINAN